MIVDKHRTVVRKKLSKEEEEREMTSYHKTCVTLRLISWYKIFKVHIFLIYILLPRFVWSKCRVVFPRYIWLLTTLATLRKEEEKERKRTLTFPLQTQLFTGLRFSQFHVLQNPRTPTQYRRCTFTIYFTMIDKHRTRKREPRYPKHHRFLPIHKSSINTLQPTPSYEIFKVHVFLVHVLPPKSI